MASAHGKRTARAMWKAQLRFGEESIPVALYATVQDRDVHFRLLHAKDHVPVRQAMVDPKSGREVPSHDIQRGLEIEEGVFVVLRPEELRAVEPPPSRSIEVTQFLPKEAIDPGWYDRPYWLGPDGSEKQYFALAGALADSGRLGIARWVLRGKRYFGALEPHGAYLSLVSMHSADEVVSADQIGRPGGPAVSKEERKLAEQLVASLDAPFDPSALHDDYRERVEQLVAAKAKGRHIEIEEAPAPGAPSDLRDALRKSLKAAKGRRRAAA
jgi:DNA end-binding protein Ku